MSSPWVPLDSLSTDLRAHLRYPDQLYTIQTGLYATATGTWRNGIPLRRDARTLAQLADVAVTVAALAGGQPPTLPGSTVAVLNRTWTATDACNNSTTKTQTITPPTMAALLRLSRRQTSAA